MIERLLIALFLCLAAVAPASAAVPDKWGRWGTANGAPRGKRISCRLTVPRRRR